jgi:aminoglycoside 6'-N-acetyltransferase
MQERELALVSGWLRQPHVARWYLAGSTITHELAELRQGISPEEPTHALIVLEHSRPIGFCQWYLCDHYPDHAKAVAAHAGDVGLDYAIGDPARAGRGIGTELIAELIRHIRRVHPAAGLIADPAAANVASRRVLEKNGFELLREGPVASERTGATMAIYRLAPGSSARRRRD